VRVFIEAGASAEQRAALTEITYGRAGGTGCFPIFSKTMRYPLDPQFVPLQIRINGKRGSFEAPHSGHKRASGAAHFAQNLRPSRLSLLHCEQRIRPSLHSARQLVEQGLGFFQISRVEALGEPVVNAGEYSARHVALALLEEEPS
jgi:hypothetical protein